jgi:N-methylhydantoinase A
MVKPDPPASLADTREAVERMDARGNTLVAVDTEQVKAVIEDLVGSGVESLTISLINSYVNGAHEQQIADLVEELHPGFPVTISSAVLPEFREYERTLTACMNSYVRPQVAQYVDRLQRSLSELGVKTEVDILRSDAGVMTPKEAARNPVYGVLSGPSGGVAGALYVAARAGYPNVLTFDMGGTSTDVSLCQGEPTIGRETTIGQFRIKVPSVDVHTVGAGGGSIAHVPQLTGALRVGPQSAGAEPGPAAYGQGGEEPTVTDANVVLGHLPADLIGGEMTLDVEAARAAVGKVAEAMSLSLEEAADGILRIVNENMAGALRVISVQRGHDPREFALVAFGGAGPLHANAVAELMGSFPVIVPPSPGLLCALGDLVAGFRNEFAQTLIRLTSEVHDADEILGELESRAREWMDAQGIAPGDQHIEFIADMRYRGQGYEIPVPWGEGLEETFNELHEQLYGFRMPNTASEIVNLRAVGTGDRPQPVLPEEDPVEAMLEAGTHARSQLHPGCIVPGPSIITEFDSTTVVLDGYVAEVDRYFNILIRKGS